MLVKAIKTSACMFDFKIIEHQCHQCKAIVYGTTEKSLMKALMEHIVEVHVPDVHVNLNAS